MSSEPYGDGFDTFVARSRRGPGPQRLPSLTGDRQLAEDLVQTALAKVAMRWDRVGRGRAPGGLPCAPVMVRTAIGWHRRKWSAEVPAADGVVPEVVAGDDTRRRRRPGPVAAGAAAPAGPASGPPSSSGSTRTVPKPTWPPSWAAASAPSRARPPRGSARLRAGLELELEGEHIVNAPDPTALGDLAGP